MHSNVEGSGALKLDLSLQFIREAPFKGRCLDQMLRIFLKDSVKNCIIMMMGPLTSSSQNSYPWVKPSIHFELDLMKSLLMNIIESAPYRQVLYPSIPSDVDWKYSGKKSWKFQKAKLKWALLHVIEINLILCKWRGHAFYFYKFYWHMEKCINCT